MHSSALAHDTSPGKRQERREQGAQAEGVRVALRARPNAAEKVWKNPLVREAILEHVADARHRMDQAPVVPLIDLASQVVDVHADDVG
jgi:hypothetical protein